jgi:pilus assembly protein CpaE
MLDILMISSDDERATQIAALVAQHHAGHRLRTVRAPASRLAEFAELAKAADLVIVDDVHLAQRDLGAIETVTAAAPQVSCMLVAPSLSKDWLVAAMRAGVRHVLSWPIDRTELAAELALVATKKASNTGRDGRLVSFLSPRGGSGTTLIAVNLAHTLAVERKKRVLLLDLNRQFADANLMLVDQTPSATIADLCANVDRLDGAFFDACAMHLHPNLDVIAGAGDPVKAADLRAPQLERLLAFAQPRYDAVIADLGQTVDPLSMLALDRSTDICLVARQSVSHLHSGRRLVGMLRELGYAGSKLRLLINQYDKAARVETPMLEQALGLRVAHRLPRDDKHASEASDRGMPLAEVSKTCPLAQSVDTLAEMLWPQTAAAAPSLLSRLFAAKPAQPGAPLRALKTEP